MNWQLLFEFLTVLQLFNLSQNSYVQDAKQRIRAEVKSIIGPHHHPHQHSHSHHHQRGGASPKTTHQYEHHHASSRRVHHLHSHHRNRWSSGHRKSMEHHHFTGWSEWSVCSSECVKRRERYCKAKRKCGFTKHVEERKCWHCHPSIGWHQDFSKHHGGQQQQQQQQQTVQQAGSTPNIIINAAAASSGTTHHQFVVQPTLPPPPLPPVTVVHHHIQMPVLQEIVGHHHHHQHSSDHEDESHRYQPLELEPDTETVVASDEDGVIRGDADGDISTSSARNSIEQVDHHNGYNEVEDDFFVLNTRPKYKKKRQPKPIYIDVADYADLEADEHDDELEDFESFEDNENSEFGPVHSLRSYQRRNKGRKRRQRLLRRPEEASKLRQRELLPSVDDGIEGDTFQYEDFDFDHNGATLNGYNSDNGDNGDDDNYGYNIAKQPDTQYSDSYEDSDYTDLASYRNSTLLMQSKEKATPDGLVPRHRRLYSKWSRWTKCSPKCTTRRYKKCRVREQCGREVLREIAYCYTEGSFCQQWLQAQLQRSAPYELRPIAAARRRDISVDGGMQSNSIDSDFIINGKGYRGPEYTPLKLKCGIAPIRSNKRNMYNMLKIIGGKAARKGEWPWQVAIFNRFKEAFCGGTLVAPQWVLTAAHCVRKVLYVRMGEHNLDYEDGTELQLRVLKSFKHPNFDKKTVDSDVALLRLPKPVNTTTWIGFSCLPRPYQPLPKNVDCTVIGWGKRRNRDAAGTSVLHQAEVPIIPMDNCRSVYHDYTITKNMFCAGHKRGRIDTCAGDSGGPLLCRDTTKPNHPWTIFGITSFGDGCAKRNKFGIYAKVPNYVDWVWSVINCNGNCKLHQRNYG